MTNLSEVRERLTSRVTKTKTGCHEWQGAKDMRGYGIIRVDGRQVRAHRAALACSLGRHDLLAPVPQDLRPNAPVYVLHSCDNPTCVNPAHLRLGSAWDNVQDRTDRNRLPSFNPNLPRKLTDAAVREIRQVAQSWDGLCDMMKKHRIGQAAVNDVVNRKSYKHVAD